MQSPQLRMTGIDRQILRSKQCFTAFVGKFVHIHSKILLLFYPPLLQATAVPMGFFSGTLA
jgi:hypothetical protein